MILVGFLILCIVVLTVAIHFQQHADGERAMRAWQAARHAWIYGQLAERDSLESLPEREVLSQSDCRSDGANLREISGDDSNEFSKKR